MQLRIIKTITSLLQTLRTPIPSRITICYYTGAAYAASIGGLGTLLGTGTNLTYKGIYENRFPEGNPIDFFRFTIYNTPGMLLGTFLVWVYLQVVYMGMFRPNSKAAQEATISKEGETIAHGVIMNRYGELGPITSHEISVAILFVISIALFFTRKPGFTTGWADLLPEKYALFVLHKLQLFNFAYISEKFKMQHQLF